MRKHLYNRPLPYLTHQVRLSALPSQSSIRFFNYSMVSLFLFFSDIVYCRIYVKFRIIFMNAYCLLGKGVTYLVMASQE